MDDFEELRGSEAKKFADENLLKKSVNREDWIVEYEDPKTGKRYVMDYVDPSAHGGGIPRLRPAD